MEQFPQAPSPESIESEIEKLLEKLDDFNDIFDQLVPEDKATWYDIEMEARAGKNRATAKEELQKFLNYLKKQKRD